MVAPVPGYSETYVSQNPPGAVGIRNAYLVYPGPDGYKAGSEATAKLFLFNDTPSQVNVVIKSDVGTVKQDLPIVIPPDGYVLTEVKLSALKQQIRPGESAKITVEFVGIKEFSVPLTIAPPDTPLPRSPMPAEGGATEGH